MTTPALPDVTARVAATVGEECGLGTTCKFIFPGEGFLYIDGLAKPNTVSNDDRDSVLAITVSLADFVALLDHRLNPQVALMTGKMRLKGDLRLASRLNKVFPRPTTPADTT